MPEASDGKKFPYTKQGMADYEKYQASLDRKNKNMGDTDSNKNKKKKPTLTWGALNVY